MHDWRDELRLRLQGLDLSPTREAELIEELSGHLREREAALLRSGVEPDEARRTALDEIADTEKLRRDLERVLPPPSLEPPLAAPSTGGFRFGHIGKDLRYAVRTLIRDRGYAVTAVLALAIGIGGASAIFAAVDAVLLRPMPFPHADRLVVPVTEIPARGTELGSTSFADYMDWRAEKEIFEAVALWYPATVDITGDGDPERVEADVVSEEYFRLIDVTPVKGRTLQPADHLEAAPRVTVITHQLWQRRFGGGDVVGKVISVGGRPAEIVGVLPPRSVWPDTGELFLPLKYSFFNEDVRTRRDNLIFQNFARLKDGVAIEQGNARLAMIATKLEQEHPNSRKGYTNRLVPLREYIVESDVSRALYVLLAAVGAVLLIVCANVANLALVRGQARARELAIRLSLGASRGRLIQQLVTESVVLAGIGAGFGALIAAGAMKGLVAMAPEGTPFVDAIALDARVLIVMMAIAAFAVIAAGLLPALVTSGLRLSASIKDGSAGAGSSARAARLRHGFVVFEIAAAVVLLVGASLLLRSFGRLTSVDPGVDLDRVLTARISLPSARYPDAAKRSQFHADLASRLLANPAIEQAAAASWVPAGTGGFGLGRVFLPDGRPEPPAAPDVAAQWNTVTPAYFRAVGIKLLDGREFTDHDKDGATPVMMVTQSFARAMFGDEPALGKRVRSWRDENVYREIVGIVSEVRYEGLTDAPKPQVYVPYAQDSWGSMLLVIRARGGDPMQLVPSVRQAVGSLDSLLAVARVSTMAQAASASVAAQRYATLLTGVLAGLAIVLAALGVYGVMSYVFTTRRREMGIRLALGAPVSSVYRLVFRYGFLLTGLGLVIGSAAAIAASRWLATILYETSAADAYAWGAMFAAIVLAATIACFGPARRSAKADPVSVLRVE